MLNELTPSKKKALKKKAVLIKSPPEMKEWIRKRRDNLQKFVGIPGVQLSLMDAQRIIAQTNGVDINREILKRLEKSKK